MAGPQTPPSRSEEDTSGSSQHNVKFLTSNCVLVTNYCGDVAHVVDEHFARALSHNAGFDTKHGIVTGKGEDMSRQEVIEVMKTIGEKVKPGENRHK